MFMSHQHTAGQNDNVRVVNKALKNMVEFKYFVTVVTNQNCIHEEIKSRLNLGKACYHAVQYLFSSHLLLKHVKIKIYRTIILTVVLYGCETWSFTLQKNIH
jgi:hypothetical protein